MKKISVRILSFLLCLLMVINSGVMIAMPAVAAEATATVTNPFAWHYDDFESYEAGKSLPKGDHYSLTYNGNEQTVLVVEEEGRGNVVQMKAGNRFFINAPQRNRMITFDFKYEVDKAGTTGGFYMKPYDNGTSDQAYAIYSNGTKIGADKGYNYGGICVKEGANSSIIGMQKVDFEEKWYTTRVMVAGKKLYFKVWPAGETEPVNWTVTATTANTAFANATAPFAFAGISGGDDSMTFWFDNLRVEKVYADDFEDYTGTTVTSAENSLYDYTKNANLATATDTTHGKVLSVASGAALQIPLEALNKDVTFDLMFPTLPTSKNVGLYARIYRASTGTGVATSSLNTLHTILGPTVDCKDGNQQNNGFRQVYYYYAKQTSSTGYAQANGFGTPNSNVSYTAGTWYTVKLRLEGSTYSTKVWPAGTAEPETWNITGTVTLPQLQAEGALVAFNASSASFQMDNLVITDLPKAPSVNITAEAEAADMGTVSVSGTTQDNGFEYNTDVTLKATANAGYQFDGWYLNDTLVSYADEYVIQATAVQHYVAKFSADPAYTWFTDDFNSYQTGTVDRDSMPLLYVNFEPTEKLSIVNDNGDQYLKYDSNSEVAVEVDCSVVEKEVSFDFFYETAFQSYGGYYVRMLYSATSSDVQYFSINPNYGSENIIITSYISGNTYQKKQSYSFNNQTWYSVKSRMKDNMIYVKIWPKSEAEPATWTVANNVGGAIASNENARFGIKVTNRGLGDSVARVDNLQIRTWEELTPKAEVQFTAEANDATMGTVTGGGRYLEGNTVTANATANKGYTFVNWTDEDGNEIGIESTYTCQLGQEDLKVTANFRKLIPEVKSFMANGMTGPAVLDAEAKTIQVTFAADVDLTQVTPYFYIQDDDGTGKAEPYAKMDLSNGNVVELINGWTVTAKQNKVMKIFYVDGVNGSDENNGTSLKQAFKTLAKARDAVREITEWTGDVFIDIADGEYLFTETLEFDHRDSAENGCAIIYRALNGEEGKVSFSGGQKLTGWVESDEVDGAWELSVPGMAYSRDLYVNGEQATLARSEDFTVGTNGSDPCSTGAEGTLTLDKENYAYQATGNFAEMATWRNVSNIEFVYEIKWSYNIVPVASADANGVIKMHHDAMEAGFAKVNTRPEAPSYIQNAFEYLDEEGEWYFDKAGETIYYIPVGGANPNEQNIVVPVVDQFVNVKGAEGQTVNGLGFQDITFEYAGFLRPNTEGQIEHQANFSVDKGNLETYKKIGSGTDLTRMTAGVEANYANGLRFAGCDFRCIAGTGLDLYRGVKGSTVVGNTFTAIGGTGLLIGGVGVRDAQPFSDITYIDGVLVTGQDPDPDRVIEQILVMSNGVENAGTNYKGSIGIQVAYGRDITLAHNSLNNLPYTGISIGWGWGRWNQGGRPLNNTSGFHNFETPNVMERYVVENNRITKIMQRMVDGGAIYTLSHMAGSIISGNYISEVSGPYGNIYLDEGAGGFVEISENISTNDCFDPYFYHVVDGDYFYAEKRAMNKLIQEGNNFFVETYEGDALDSHSKTLDYGIDSSDDPLYDIIKNRAGTVDAPYTVHNEVILESKEATCAESGLTEGRYCSDCGEVLVAQEEIPALDHDIGSFTVHTFCEEEGYITCICRGCDEEFDSRTDKVAQDYLEELRNLPFVTIDLSAQGHKWDEGAVTDEPTYTEEGVMTYTCQRDSNHTYTKPIAKLERILTADSKDGDFLYKDGERINNYNLVEYDGSIYYVHDYHRILKDATVYVGETYVVGSAYAPAYYTFDAEGKMSPANGPANGCLYIDGELQKAYQLMEFDGNFYFINDGHKLAVNQRIYLNETEAAKAGLAADYYEFDGEGKLVRNDGVINDFLYVNGEQKKAYQLVKYGGDYYFVGDYHKIIRNKNVYIGEAYLGESGLKAGYYTFGEDGKMQILNGPVGDYFYKDNVRQNAYQLVEYDGDFYFINDYHKLAKDKKIYLNATNAEKAGVTVGYHNFGADGKLIK